MTRRGGTHGELSKWQLLVRASSEQPGKRELIRKLGCTGRCAPTWAKTDGTGQHGKPTSRRHPWSGGETLLDAHVAPIKPTTGLCPHAILCPSTPRHLLLLLLSRTASPPAFSIFFRSSPPGCYMPPSPSSRHLFPRCHSSRFPVSSQMMRVVSSWKSSCFPSALSYFDMHCTRKTRLICKWHSRRRRRKKTVNKNLVDTKK